MDKSLTALCDSLKKIISQLKPQNQALSFLLLIGKENQGKTTLLRQSQLQHVTVDAERSTEIYYNKHGVILELANIWPNQPKSLLQNTLKQLNRCHRALRITGVILCVDVNELLNSDPVEFAEQSKTHAQLLRQIGLSLGKSMDTAIIFTKADALAGFCEFFQNEHNSDLKKPLGCSLLSNAPQDKLLNQFKTQFDQFVEMLGQQVINKMHPARSGLKRTLIREFPLQLASLRLPIQSLIQNSSSKLLPLEGIYFTSAEQGGVSVDRLNKKIQHEYALVVQDKYPQAINHRAYFVEGALATIQAQTKHYAPHYTPTQIWLAGGLIGIISCALLGLWQHHTTIAAKLNQAGEELLAYESLHEKKYDTKALYHLSKASEVLSKTPSYSLPHVKFLKKRLNIHSKQSIRSNFVPLVLASIEQVLADSSIAAQTRYQALKIYLMLGSAQWFSASEVVAWFQQHWQQDSSDSLQNKLMLLREVLVQPLQPMPINAQIVSDARNYLNALPQTYLYYTLAKKQFTQDVVKLSIDGFDLAESSIPVYFTKAGFQNTINLLPNMSGQFQQDNWVLARQDLGSLPSLLQESYCNEYVLWWQNFMQKSRPHHVQDYSEALKLVQSLNHTQALNRLVQFVQEQVSPEISEESLIFNQAIASKFATLNMLSSSAIQEVTRNIAELEPLLVTLNTVNDQGKTAFSVVKSRFMGDTLSNPLSTLYTRVQQLPEPASVWIKQISDDTWFTLINQSKDYLNGEWKQHVFSEYQRQIAQRYPFDNTHTSDVSLIDFDHFFAPHGVLNSFIETYLKPFLDTSRAEWQLKEVNNYVLPISSEIIHEFIRANVITNMFFPEQSDRSRIEFSLQKLNLDPIVSSLQLFIGSTKLTDDQNSNSFKQFSWPQSGSKLVLNSIEGQHYELEEVGPWAFFKILQKVNVLADEQDTSNLQILFEVNGNSGRYVLKTQNQINPFIPGILNGFNLPENIA